MIFFLGFEEKKTSHLVHEEDSSGLSPRETSTPVRVYSSQEHTVMNGVILGCFRHMAFYA